MSEPGINKQKRKSSIWKLISKIGGGSILVVIIGFLLPKLWPENKPPDAQIACSQTKGIAPLDVICDGLKSSDPEGKTLTYEWSIDGNIISHDPSLQVTFPTAKTYHVVLKVSDHKNLYDTDSVMIAVTLPQTSPIVTPTSTPAPKSTDTPKATPTAIVIPTPTFTPKPILTSTPTLIPTSTPTQRSVQIKGIQITDERGDTIQPINNV